MESNYEQRVEALRLCQFGKCGCGKCYYKELKGDWCTENNHPEFFDCDDKLKLDAADTIEELVKRVKCAEEKIKLYKGEADLYKSLYRSANEAFTKALYGSHGTLANLQSLTQSPIPHNLCPNRAEEAYDLCANYPKKPDCSENPNG